MPQPTTKKGSTQFHKNATILVIEDNHDQWQLTRRAIEQTFLGVKPVWAASGQQALEVLQDCQMLGVQAPLLILLDLYLPQQQVGWHVLEQIRALPAPLGVLPLILLSSSDQGEDIHQSYDRGITTYLVKPTDFQAWIEVFESLKEF